MKQWKRPARPEPKAEHCCAKCTFCTYDPGNPAKLGTCGNQKARKPADSTVRTNTANTCPEFRQRGAA